MAMYFEEGTGPDGNKGDMFVVERGAGDKAVFPADALTPDGQLTYREKYAAIYDAYKNGDKAGSNVDPAAHPASQELSNQPGTVPGQPAGAPARPASPPSNTFGQPRPQPETVRPPGSETNVGADKRATDKATSSKL